MKRDMDLIRELLLRLEALEVKPGAVVAVEPYDSEISVDGYDAGQIDYHLSLIQEAGFVDSPGTHPMQGILFRRLSWAGHDFLDSIRDPEVWKKTKEGVAAARGFTVDLLKDLAKGLIKKQLEELTGVRI